MDLATHIATWEVASQRGFRDQNGRGLLNPVDPGSGRLGSVRTIPLDGDVVPCRSGGLREVVVAVTASDRERVAVDVGHRARVVRVNQEAVVGVCVRAKLHYQLVVCSVGVPVLPVHEGELAGRTQIHRDRADRSPTGCAQRCVARTVCDQASSRTKRHLVAGRQIVQVTVQRQVQQ